MMFTLDNFEQNIDTTILKRGYDYYKNFQVNEPEIMSTGKFEFIVEGSVNYLVHITINGNEVLDYFCDCPYDSGPVCKHIAAALYYMKKGKWERDEVPKIKPKNQTKKASKPKKKTEQEIVQEILKKVSIEELASFIDEKTLSDKIFRKMFISSFAHKFEGDLKSIYANQIKSLLQSVSNRGFIDWSGARQVGQAVAEILRKAQKHKDEGSYEAAFYICCAVMETMVIALEYGDDSNGDFGGSISDAYGIICDIAEIDPSDEIRKLIFDYCVNSFDKVIFKSWDWHIDVLNLAAQLIDNDNEADKLTGLIDSSNLTGYSLGFTKFLKYKILRDHKSKSEAQNFLLDNLENHDFREEAIKINISDENYQAAISLAQDGIKQDAKDKPGIVKVWIEWLLKIAQVQNDNTNIIKYARYMLIDNYAKNQDYYLILKQTIDPENWETFFNELIAEISSRARSTFSDQISELYIREEMWEKLFEMIQKSPDLYNLDKYGKYLLTERKPELIEMYADGIYKFLEKNVGRNHYKTACRYIIKINKLGARDKADKIIANLRILYKQRPALLEELDIL